MDVVGADDELKYRAWPTSAQPCLLCQEVFYVVDHLFFALAIAMRTYFQKIADPADIAATAGVSFTINHIAAVLLPAAYGLLWLVSPALVFLSGALLATMSLALSILVPDDPREGNEVWTDFTPIGVRSATTS